jgi:hypothetical protein
VTLRRLGGAPTYVLTDNEKTVTIEHVAGMAVRNPATVAFARFYGVTVCTCEPADPASKGGPESTVKIAKADLVGERRQLAAPAYGSFAELEAACAVFCDQVNARVHRVTRRAPVEMLAQERARLHPLPATPHTVSRSEPHRRNEHPDGDLPGRAVLGAPPAARAALVGAGAWPRRRRGRDHRAPLNPLP